MTNERNGTQVKITYGIWHKRRLSDRSVWTPCKRRWRNRYRCLYKHSTVSADERHNACRLPPWASHLRRLKAHRKLHQKRRYQQAVCGWIWRIGNQGACQNVGSQAEGLSFPEVQREFYFLAPRICYGRLWLQRRILHPPYKRERKRHLRKI